MDPASINNIFSLLAFLALIVLGILQVRGGRVSKPASGEDTPVNGQPVSANYVKRLVAEHELNCKVREEIAALRREMNAGFANVSDDFRNLHERLDRAVERGK